MPSTNSLLKWPPIGLEAKFILVATAIIIAATSIGNKLILLYEESLLMEEARSRAVVLTEAMANGFTYTLAYEELGLVEEAGLLDLFVEDMMARTDLQVQFVKLLNPRSQVIAHSDFRQYGKFDESFYTFYGDALQTTHTRRYIIEGENILEIASPLRIASKSWGYLIVGVSLSPAERELEAFADRMGYLTLTAIFAAILIAFLLAHTLARPIKRLAIAMAQVGPEIEDHMQIDRRDEIGMLQSSFKDMLKRLRLAREEQERTREAMLRAEKLAAVGSLASGVAHEINNPLGGMKNCLAQIEQRPDDQERFLAYVRLMRQALDRIEQVVRGLLDFSRRRELDKAPLDLQQIIEGSLLLLDYQLKECSISLSLKIDPHMPIIEGDTHQLQQVLINLILNAIDVMRQGGQLRIELLRSENFALLRICDSGPGIPPDLERRIFDPFFSTKQIGHGTGLGLTVSLSIAREHGGDLSFANLPAGGSVFTLALPLRETDSLSGERTK